MDGQIMQICEFKVQQESFVSQVKSLKMQKALNQKSL